MYNFPGNIELIEFKRGRDKRKRKRRNSLPSNTENRQKLVLGGGASVNPNQHRRIVGAGAGLGLAAATLPGIKKRSILSTAKRGAIGAIIGANAGNIANVTREVGKYQINKRKARR